jgi:hypothetical protein
MLRSGYAGGPGQTSGTLNPSPDSERSSKMIKEARRKSGYPPILDREQMKKRNRDFVAEINRFMAISADRAQWPALGREIAGPGRNASE